MDTELLGNDGLHVCRKVDEIIVGDRRFFNALLAGVLRDGPPRRFHIRLALRVLLWQSLYKFSCSEVNAQKRPLAVTEV